MFDAVLVMYSVTEFGCTVSVITDAEGSISVTVFVIGVSLLLCVLYTSLTVSNGYGWLPRCFPCDVSCDVICVTS